MEIAEVIKNNIPPNKIISEINILKRGFMNIEVSDTHRSEILKKVIN